MSMEKEVTRHVVSTSPQTGALGTFKSSSETFSPFAPLPRQLRCCVLFCFPNPWVAGSFQFWFWGSYLVLTEKPEPFCNTHEKAHDRFIRHALRDALCAYACIRQTARCRSASRKCGNLLKPIETGSEKYPPRCTGRQDQCWPFVQASQKGRIWACERLPKSKK